MIRLDPYTIHIQQYQKHISQAPTQLVLNNDEIKMVDSFNFQGVTIDKQLHWKQHLQTEIVVNKLSKYYDIFY